MSLATVLATLDTLFFGAGFQLPSDDASDATEAVSFSCVFHVGCGCWVGVGGTATLMLDCHGMNYSRCGGGGCHDQSACIA